MGAGSCGADALGGSRGSGSIFSSLRGEWARRVRRYSTALNCGFILDIKGQSSNNHNFICGKKQIFGCLKGRNQPLKTFV